MPSSEGQSTSTLNGDTQVAACVEEAGAKYGPAHRKEFLACIARLDLSPFFGKVAKGRVRSVEFELRNKAQQEMRLASASAEWVVILDQAEQSMVMVFEPFGGHLVLATVDRKLPTRKPE